MWKCVPDMECGSPSSSYMDDRQACFRACVGADIFASTLPYMWFLRPLWKVLLIECCNVWTWNTTFTHGLRSLAWLPDKIEWVERDDGVCVIASQPFLNLHSEHFKVKTKEMLLYQISGGAVYERMHQDPTSRCNWSQPQLLGAPSRAVQTQTSINLNKSFVMPFN